MVSTRLVIAEFPKTIERYSTKVEDEQLERIVESIDKLRKQNPAVYDEKAVAIYLQERSKTLNGMVEEYFTASVANKFPLISDELFQLRRHLTLVDHGKTWRVVRDDTEAERYLDFTTLKEPVKPSEPEYKVVKRSVEEAISVGRKRIRSVSDDSEYQEKMKQYRADMKLYTQQMQEWDKEKKELEDRKKKVVRIKVPLFAYTPLFDGKYTAKLGSFSKTRRDSYGDTHRTTATIEAKLPGSIGPNLKEAYRDALSHYFGVLSEMFTSPVAGDIIYAEGNLAQPEVGAIWIPIPESLNVSVDTKLIQKRKSIDPAMILKVRGKNYLVQTWRVDDEQPFEHYLREFSIGPLRGKL